MINMQDKFFPNVEFFEDEHKYIIEGEYVFPSVSSFVEDFKEPFNRDFIALKYAEKRGLLVKDVIDAWEGNAKISTDNGSDVHIYGEEFVKAYFFKTREDYPKVTCMKCLGVQMFWRDLPNNYEPVALELIMYLKEFGIVGTTDIVLRNKDSGNYIIADYKTNEELFDTSFSKGNPIKILPLELGILQRNFDLYTVQVNLYEFMFRRATGFEVEDRWIIHIKKSDFEVYEAPSIQEYIEPYLSSKLR